MFNSYGNFKYTARCNAHLDLSACFFCSVFVLHASTYGSFSLLKEETFIQKYPNASKRNLVNTEKKI